MNHKNRATLFSIITSAFLARFFIMLVQVETGSNTLQRTYLINNDSITASRRLLKVYLAQLVLKIKYIEFEYMVLYRTIDSPKFR